MSFCWNSVTRCLPSISLIGSLATKALAEAALYLPDASCPEQLQSFANVACVASIGAKALEMLISPSHFENKHCLIKYHGKIALVACGTAIIGFGLYEGLCGFYGAALACDQIYALTSFAVGATKAGFPSSSVVLNSVSLACSGLVKIFSGKAMLANGMSIKV